MRRRVIFHGIRCDLNTEPLLPKPCGHGRHLTVAEAWAGLPAIQRRITPTGKLAILVPRIKPGSDGRYTNPEENYYSTKRLAWNKTAFTVCAQVSHCQGLLLHPDIDNGISIAEVARLQSFPDEFKLAGHSWKQRWLQLGNAVPPMLARAVGEAVRLGN